MIQDGSATLILSVVVQLIMLVFAAVGISMRVSSYISRLSDDINAQRRELHDLMERRMDGLVRTVDEKAAKAHKRIESVDSKYDAKVGELHTRVNDHGGRINEIHTTLLTEIMHALKGIANGGRRGGGNSQPRNPDKK